MAENKLGISNSAELARAEEKTCHRPLLKGY